MKVPWLLNGWSRSVLLACLAAAAWAENYDGLGSASISAGYVHSQHQQNGGCLDVHAHLIIFNAAIDFTKYQRSYKECQPDALTVYGGLGVGHLLEAQAGYGTNGFATRLRSNIALDFMSSRAEWYVIPVDNRVVPVVSVMVGHDNAGVNAGLLLGIAL